MVDTVKIADLPSATNVTGNDVLIIEQAGSTRKIAAEAFMKSSGIVSRGSMFFDTVANMRASTALVKGSVAVTRGYHKATGHGGAEYDIWDLDEYRAAIANPTWKPDGETKIINSRPHYAGGDHALQNNLVAILRYDMLWAGQLGLEDPVQDEDEYLLRGVNHDFGLDKAGKFAKAHLSTNLSSSGEGGYQVRRNAILHIENGRYVITKTIWIGANVLLCGGDSWGSPGRVVDIIPLKPHLGGNLNNYVRGFMFIFNGNEFWPGTEEIPVGSTPAETIYIAPYVGGMSSMSLSNYETAYGTYADGSTNWYAPNYLRGIRGAMVFGGGCFECTTGDRISQMYHRPGVDWLDYYTDGWRIIDYKCNTPLENLEYQLDFNGSGDVINIEQIQFPVNHPPANPGPDDMWPQGEYLNGVVKGIRLHNWASWDIRPPGEGGSQEMISYVGAGMQIERVINGDISIFGYRQVMISACHFEFGQINLHIGSAIVDGCYFSKITGAKYNSINCYSGPFGGGPSSQLSLKNCEFHRGFDGAHYPEEEGYYDVALAGNYSVDIKDCFQGWDVGDNNLAVGLTVGLYSGLRDETIVPFPGWDRWSPYLSQDCQIVNGKLMQKEMLVTWNGFEGVQEVYNTKSSSIRNWDLDSGIDLYYYAQYIADIGDSTVGPDFIPLGRNQRERNVLDAQENDTGVRYEAHVFLKAPETAVDPISGSSFTQYYRPVPSFYREEETPDIGYLRLYRGRSPYQYSEYVDLPLMARADVNDRGTTCFGRKWKPNPVPFDTNPNVAQRVRNLLPITGEPMTKYKLWMRAGAPITLRLDIPNDFYGRPRFNYVGTGGWKAEETVRVLDASNKHAAAIEEGLTKATSIFNRPFTEDTYVGLPVTGAWNWDNSKRLKFEKGAEVVIARSFDTINNGVTYGLILQVDKADGTQETIYNIAPGEIITAYYDEKEVLVGGTYVIQGEWIVGKAAKVAEEFPVYLYFEPTNDDHQLLMPVVQQPTQTLATYDYTGSGEVYASLANNVPQGCIVTIVRTAAHTGTLFLMAKNPDESTTQTFEITTNNIVAVFVRRRNGWVWQSTTALA
ncbi:hypothetical protein [Citrobacter phage Tr1]|nr:hypothetical protein [Citrobacter phage Tr1]